MVLNKKLIIGKTDIVDLPLFNLVDVKVKIDSGAYTSTIHCSSIEETDDGLAVVFLDKKHQGYTGETLYFKEFQQKRVRSSNGKMQLRYAIKGDILIFEKKYSTEFTLSKRDLMRYPVLLGRKLLSRRFLIDVDKINLSYNKKK